MSLNMSNENVAISLFLFYFEGKKTSTHSLYNTVMLTQLYIKLLLQCITDHLC